LTRDLTAFVRLSPVDAAASTGRAGHWFGVPDSRGDLIGAPCQVRHAADLLSLDGRSGPLGASSRDVHRRLRSACGDVGAPYSRKIVRYPRHPRCAIYLIQRAACFRIEGLSEEEKPHVHRVWHRLHGWPDAVAGLTRVRTRFVSAPLSNTTVSDQQILSGICAF